MPDLPTPRDATEAALFSECWDAVLSYADLCTAGTEAATELATEAFARGMREARAAEHTTRGRRAPRLPRIPLLLTAVRVTAAAWEAGGRGQGLDPDLRLWLNSGQADRWTGPPLRRPVALRALRDLQETDAALLWLVDVEALPLATAARRLGLDPADAADELAQVRGLFRERCRRNHLDTPMDARCRSYARLLDAVTRSPAHEAPADLARHLATCARCAEAAACLRQGAALPGALAGGVLGWGGLAYLERRRRAADVRLGAGRPDAPEAEPAFGDDGAHRARVVRGGLLVAAVLVSLLALAVSLMPQSPPTDAAEAGGTADRGPVAVPTLAVPTAGPTSAASPSAASPSPSRSPRPSRSATSRPPGKRSGPGPAPRDTPSATSRGRSTPAPDTAEPPSCHVRYDLVNQWPDGFQATVTVTTEAALDAWRVAWAFPDDQQVRQMWDATYTQDGDRVTATAADYNRTVRAGGSVTFGFLASWRGRNAPPPAFTLNGYGCATS
ncbi:cellulose-binding domain-containing protein [Streptomyces sp. DH24]|uniref:cellulose-binding domain-containing protein n=1 Tax=Streptomyces sp. DH24 TaxID=3040123 RepID=UPI0024430D30|nr:cellulose-binding domain-containing protein [Streptomyces sp. DH24]MDG9717786.1 cellulose-binding domain-containing protein [Streptomyces sp. DH24]